MSKTDGRTEAKCANCGAALEWGDGAVCENCMGALYDDQQL